MTMKFSSTPNYNTKQHNNDTSTGANSAAVLSTTDLLQAFCAAV